MKQIPFSNEWIKLQKQWFKKDAEARAEIKNAVEILNQFTIELERLENHRLN